MHTHVHTALMITRARKRCSGQKEQSGWIASCVLSLDRELQTFDINVDQALASFGLHRAYLPNMNPAFQTCKVAVVFIPRLHPYFSATEARIDAQTK